VPESARPAQGFESGAVLAVAVGFVSKAATVVPAPGQIDENVVDDSGRLLAGTELVQFEAAVFRPEIGGDGPAAVGGRRAAQASWLTYATRVQ
jgi:hypothetical protein